MNPGDALGGDLDRYYLLHAARADLLRRLGSPAEAAKSYARALALVTNDAERRFLERRLCDVQPSERDAPTETSPIKLESPRRTLFVWEV